jgi:hypothetical protein
MYTSEFIPLLGVAKWLRRCATCRTVPESIPGGVTGFFSDIFPTQWKWVPGTFLGVKAVGAWGWQPYHLHVMKSGSLNLLERSGPYRACYGTPLPLLTPRTRVLVMKFSSAGTFPHFMEPEGSDMFYAVFTEPSVFVTGRNASSHH